MSRKFPRRIQRVVIKIGSSLIAQQNLKPNKVWLRSLVRQITVLRSQNIDVVIVTSGAIVLGLGELNKTSRAVGLPFLQASAAIGQSLLMRIYCELFEKQNMRCAQILLTWDDFDNRKQYTNARKTLNTLFESGVVPIINENDSISTDEIRRGDNDKLSALVASLTEADLLILLSDVDGLYKISEGEKEVLQEVAEITEEIHGLAKGTAKKLFAKGGMRSKLESIHIASHAKIPAIIANGRTKNVIKRIMDKERIGTLFLEKDEKMLDRKHWISFGAKSKGTLFVDDGACKVLLQGGKSLLLPGVVKWNGLFKVGDVVVICDQKSNEIARGICNYAAHTLDNIEMQNLSKKGIKEVIHVDDLVLGQK